MSAEYVGIRRLVSIFVLVASLALAATAPGGGISDEPCLNIAGENTNTCPAGVIGAPYLLKFVEREGSGCGPGRQTFHLDSGELPPRLAVASDGTLSGVPTQAGTFQFYVEMREPQDDPVHCAGKRTQKQFTLTICSRLGIVPTPALPPRAEVRAPFRMTLSWCDGLGALTWAAAGALPTGVTLRADGTITGVPRDAGRYRFTATAKDVRGRVSRYAGTISVARRLRIRTRQLPQATAGRKYRATLAVIGGAGLMSWTISHGRLPRGVRLDEKTGVLSGVPEKAGTHRFTVEVDDVLEVEARSSFAFVVRGVPTKRPARGR